MIYSQDEKEADQHLLQTLNEALFACVDHNDPESFMHNTEQLQDILAKQMKLLNAICKRCAVESRQSYDADRKLQLALRAQNQFRTTMLAMIKLSATEDTAAQSGTENSGTNYTNPANAHAEMD